MKTLFKIISIFLLTACSIVDMHIPLPNGFLWNGDKLGSSHLSFITDESSSICVDNVVDIYVVDKYVYGFKTNPNTYFSIDTKLKDVIYYNTSDEYSKFLKKNNLPDGYISNSINILEARKGLKKIYWLDN